MQIKQKLEYPIWKVPYLFIKGLIVFIKIIRTGILILLLENKFFDKNTALILEVLNFIFANKNQEEIGKKLLKCLINLGPGYIKLGQALSTRPDMLGKKTCDDLKALQDNLNPINFACRIMKNIFLISNWYITRCHSECINQITIITPDFLNREIRSKQTPI